MTQDVQKVPNTLHFLNVQGHAGFDFTKYLLSKSWYLHEQLISQFKGIYMYWFK